MGKSHRKRLSPIAVKTTGEANVYLSCSWQRDQGQDASWLLVDALDKLRITCLGDAKVSGDQDPSRIKRIVDQCSGGAVVIPFRDNPDQPTSEYIWQELEILAAEQLPLAIWCDDRVPLRITSSPGGKILAIDGCTKLSSVVVSPDCLYDLATFQAVASTQAAGAAPASALQLRQKTLDAFAERAKQTSPTSGEPFAFLSTRLKPDFGLARLAVQSAVEETLGITCLWADSNRFAADIKSIQERTHALIEHAQFIIADLSFGPESPDYDSPSRAHELRMAEALHQEIMLTAQGPRRDPYFAANHLQMEFWENEQQLRDIVAAWADNRKARYGRRNYNRELSLSVPHHHATLASEAFAYDERQRYVAPNAYALTSLESAVVAIGFALIALAGSLLAKDLLAFDDTFDFASIVAALATIVFASDLNGVIRGWLVRWAPLRWLIPATGLVLLAVWAAQHYTRG